jgi:hypothetical protein
MSAQARPQPPHASAATVSAGAKACAVCGSSYTKPNSMRSCEPDCSSRSRATMTTRSPTRSIHISSAPWARRRDAQPASAAAWLHGECAGRASAVHYPHVDCAPVSVEAIAELAAGRQAPPRVLNQCNAGATSGWFREDLERLFGLLATGAIRPRVAERISFDEVADAHRRLEAGGLEGKLVLCPDLPSRRDRVPLRREPRSTSVQVTPAT